MRLVKPDVPIAALERCFRGDVWFEALPLIAETYSEHPAGRWIYLASFNACRARRALRFEVALADLGALQPRAPVIALDWRSGAWERLEPDARLALALEPDAWDYRVLCPLLPGEIAVFGDTGLYATAGDRRLRGVRVASDLVAFDVCGAPGERVTIDGWSAREPARVETSGAQAWSRDAASGRWRLAVEIPDRGWVAARVRPAAR